MSLKFKKKILESISCYSASNDRSGQMIAKQKKRNKIHIHHTESDPPIAVAEYSEEFGFFGVPRSSQLLRKKSCKNSKAIPKETTKRVRFTSKKG